MENISSWASSIIVAVIIATLLEMIIPKGNNKKYIKVVLSVYIVFTMLSPLIKNSFASNLSDNIKKYGEELVQTTEYKTLFLPMASFCAAASITAVFKLPTNKSVSP